MALASFAAGTIAGAKPMRIALTAMRIGVVAFIIPFAFAYDSVLLLHGSWLNTAEVLVSASAADICCP